MAINTSEDMKGETGGMKGETGGGGGRGVALNIRECFDCLKLNSGN